MDSISLNPTDVEIYEVQIVNNVLKIKEETKKAEKVALEPMDLELYHEIGAGLMAVDPAAVESGTIRSPYTGELYRENSYT